MTGASSTNQTSESTALAGPEPAAAAPPHAPVVLVVDDTTTNRVLLEAILRREGFRTVSASDGPEARELARREQPDIILLDVMMPEESGFDCCTRLKADPATEEIPVLFISTLSEVEDKVRGLRAGGVDYISKPFHAEEVLARVRVHLRIRQAMAEVVSAQRARLEELRDAQRAILVQPAELPGASFGVYYQPRDEAGGDFYDVVAIDERTYGYFVADVSGHGLGAAFVTSAIKALVRQYSGPAFSPLDTMRSINSVLRTVLPEEKYLTACWARWNQRSSTLSVVSAGHPPLILVRAGGAAEVVETPGDPLGVFGAVTLQSVDLRMGAGDRFFLYTDGLIEGSGAGAGRRSGLEALQSGCQQSAAAPILEAPGRIVASLGNARADDDLLLLAVEVPR